MATVGWIHEGDWDRYFGSLPTPEFPPLPPPRVSCPFCAEDFTDDGAMLSHLADRHRGDRPVLLLRGKEPPLEAQHQVDTEIADKEVMLRNCTSARLALNGMPAAPVPMAKIPAMLADKRDALVALELANHFEAAAQPITTGYQLVFRIADSPALDGVDRAFRRRCAVEALDFGAVDDFLAEPACQGVAGAYAEALAAYVRGVLVKDRPDSAGVTLPFARYADLYAQSCRGLQRHRRPLANLVCGIVRFALNDFSGPPAWTGLSELDAVFADLATLAGNPPAAVPLAMATGGAQVAVCALDDGVTRILGLWRRLRERPAWSPALAEECRQAAGSDVLDADDRTKALAVWAQAALRSGPDTAAEPLARLSATYPFDTWASRERERMANGRDR